MAISLDPWFAGALGLPIDASSEALSAQFARAGGVSAPTCPASTAVLCEAALRTERFVLDRAGMWVMANDCSNAVVQHWGRRSRPDDDWQTAERDLRYLRDQPAGSAEATAKPKQQTPERQFHAPKSAGSDVS